ncbi:toll-like receptor 13 [Lingula anatina]|uniref:Toll-like receptor 13 n=1 Tax=Lingula anatina TaxID=7574 RepID=A0A1S3HEQ8_LINAN|nr:toll-like receptor 13 [Lingula anatina]|eukprot:XP_013383996.1 toll-like receptor 13 [Lingula anatina]
MKTGAVCLIIITLFQSTVNGFYCPARCHCDSSLKHVNCNGQNLSEIPTCDSTTLSLSLSSNRIAKLKNDSFTGLSQLENLTLNGNIISEIEVATFQPLGSVLNISLTANRRLHFDTLEPAFCFISKSIRWLWLNSLKILSKPSKLHSSLFHCLANSELTELNLNDNGIQTLPDSIFAGLSNLRVLRLQGNCIDTVQPTTFAGLHNLRCLDLRDNSLSKIPYFGNETHPLFPNLSELSLDHNSIETISKIDFVAVKNLERLYLDNNAIKQLLSNMLRCMTKLKHASFTKQHDGLRTIDSMAFASDSLLYLDISVNKYTFCSDRYDLFSHTPNLHELNLNSNHLRHLNSTAMETMFRNLTQLRKMYIRNAGLSVLPPNMFVNKGMLSELQLQSNSLSTWDPFVFQPLISLKKLYMNGNRISVLNETSFPRHIWNNVTEMDLSGNPFSCTCGNLYFRNWMQTTQVKLLEIHRYQCFEPKDLEKTLFLDWHPTIAQCTVWIIASAIGVSTMLFLALVIVVSHRYRWYLRYWCFSLRARYKRLEPFEDNGTYVFDAFVSYNCHDRSWVIQRLLPKLEYDAGFKLCLHDRDFIVGHDIVDNIVDGIDVSRKTILVLSNNFAQSQWCQLEMTMAQHKLFDENKDILVLILLEDIKPENLSNRLTLLLRKQTYIEWPSEEEGQELFWERVKAALRRPPEYERIP